ncbi:MAG: SDR family oxidoreductase [Gammaproteobacteria bacterium]|nr:SDR family oxidoreductase [Gammaproteobacteria bacterium]MYD79254.1 SDR family oxidoreductase [Gammaproteobacteria bacterium]
MALSELSRSISGSVALITGAASGMGKATAELFAEQGAIVAATDVQEQELQSVVENITKAGYSAHSWVLDVSDPEAIQETIGAIANKLGGLDIVINNAGIGAGGPFDADDFETRWSRALDVMLSAHQRIIRAALPHLRNSMSPRIVNIASTEGLGATKYSTAYSTAKTGVIGLTRALAVELGSEGITVNCICPGPIRTGMTAGIPEADKQEYARRRIALKRYADPEEVAHMTLSLVLPAASFVTGVALPVDGGLTIKNA